MSVRWTLALLVKRKLWSLIQFVGVLLQDLPFLNGITHNFMRNGVSLQKQHGNALRDSPSQGKSSQCNLNRLGFSTKPGGTTSSTIAAASFADRD